MNIPAIIAYILIATLLITSIELLKRRFNLQTHLTRRLTHISGSVLAALLPIFFERAEIIFIGVFFAAVMLVVRKNPLLSSIQTDRATLGEVYLPLGIALAAGIFLPDSVSAYQYGVLVMGIADALAGFIGERYGTRHVHFFSNKKSLEGALAFFVASLILTFFFAPTIDLNLLFIPLVLTFVEFCSIYGLDNLILPIAAGLLLQFI